MKHRWNIIASFFENEDVRWLDDFITDPRFTFRKIPPPRHAANWHSGIRKTTSLQIWLRHLLHARKAFADRPDGIICAFPQLTMCAALLRKFSRHKPKLVAYNYNLGGFPEGLRRRIASWVAGQVSCFVVHAPSEVASYADYLRVPQDRIRFVPLQRGDMDLRWDPDEQAPYILAMGSAHRDYPTLIHAVDALEIDTVIVTREADIAALPQSPSVTFKSGLTARECLELMARARLSVTPVANLKTASGQITFVASLHIGVPVIATECPGTEGYIEHDRTGLLVPAFDVEALKTAIADLWNDKPRREALAAEGHAEAMARFTDTAAATALHEILLQAHSDPAPR